MKMILLTGFLGSGKTTAMLSLADYLSRSYNPKSIVIIENEIGEANVDGALLAESAYEVRDLTSGCICCTLSGQLIAALEEIRRNLKPEWLLIEATGIAHRTIADIIGQSIPGLKPFSIVLADAQRWAELMENLPMLITTQVENANVVLINKIDAVSPDELALVEEEVQEITSCPCFKTSIQNADLGGLWEKVVACAVS